MGKEQKGRHVWYDLMSTDPDGAKEFYGKVVGWTITPFDAGGQPYDMWTTSDTSIGGVMRLPADAQAGGVPSHWLGYIATPDVDATAALATARGGGVVVPPQDIPTVGRFAVLRDPFGAVFCGFTPAGDSAHHGGRPRPGEISWHELMTDDYERALAFYSELFGWEKSTAMDMGEAGVYQLFRRPGAAMDDGGIMNRPPEMPASAWMYYINTDDLDGALETVKAEGGQVLHGPMVVPGGDRICVCMDPQGAAFALHEFAAS